MAAQPQKSQPKRPQPQTLSWMQTLFARELHSLERELDLFADEDQIWATLPGVTNSAGNLALHLCGNLRHFVGAVLGETGYVRDREREFSASGLVRSELSREIKLTIETLNDVLPRLSDADLAGEYPQAVAGVRMSTGLFLLHLSNHLAFHLGQVGYLRRILADDGQVSGAVSLQELATG